MIKLDGLEEYKQSIGEVVRKYPDEAEKELRKIGNNLKKKAIDKTPDGKSKKYKLKENYHLSQTKQVGGVLYVEFYSSSPHYHLIERGHKLIGKDGSEKGFVPGVHMVENSVQEIDEEMPEEIESWLEKLTKGLG